MHGLWKRVFPVTLPVMAGYLFLGIAYGIAMRARGFSTLLAGLMSTLVYGGSLQFALIDPLGQAFAPLTIALLSALVQSRHLFYGLSMLQEYRGLGCRKFYNVLALTDETYSLVVGGAPEGVDSARWYTAVTLLDQSYWVLGTLAGCLVGSWIPTDSLTGIDFAMTALFTVIVTEQTESAWRRFRCGELSVSELLFAPLLGGLTTLVSLLWVGKGSFLLLAMALMLGGFALRYRAAVPKGGARP